MFWSIFGWMGGPTMVAVWQAGAMICPVQLSCQQQNRTSRPRQPAGGGQRTADVSGLLTQGVTSGVVLNNNKTIITS